jgi:NAD(P)-dependent dehydrogenase (short-subunit alcohol dehydrogenase family)
MIPKELSVGGKVAIITGAGRGIGKAIALVLAEGGADIVVVARTAKQIEQTAEEIRKLGQKALAIPTDVTSEDQIKAVVEQTISQFGKIDILVNNAGIGPPEKPVVFIPGAKFPGWELTDNWDKQLTPEEWNQVIATNLTSALLFVQAVGSYMLRQKKGKVINISSNSADLGTPYWAPYCSSKAALSMFTRCLASEWAPFNICVNAIGPGNTRTEMMEKIMKEDPKVAEWVLAAIPMGRLAEPREIALLAFYLASDASNFLTGQTIYIDGGQLGMGRGP